MEARGLRKELLDCRSEGDNRCYYEDDTDRRPPHGTIEFSPELVVGLKGRTMSKGQRAGLEAKAEVTSGFVSTSSTNLRGEAGKVLEPAML